MLASLLAKYHRPGDIETCRFDAWTAALAAFRAEVESGALPPIAGLASRVAALPAEQIRDALEEIVAEHLHATWRIGHGQQLEAYASELEDTGQSERLPAELIEDEFLARYQLPHGDRPSLDEYRQRFAHRSDVIELLAHRFIHGERYVKLRQLGLGAMGEVWQAFDRHLSRMVALKEPRVGCGDSTSALRRFADEARVTAELDYPGIVSVHELHAANSARPCYVMRLVTGRTFAERIRDFHQPPLERTPADTRLLRHELLRALVNVANAVAFAHSRGVAHCDLKPGNVIVGDFGEAVILDWGMARRLGHPDAGARGAVAGTPDYMAPEQTDGFADERSDVFGLGAVLYELLTARSPQGWQEGARPSDWVEKVRAERFERPRQIDPDASRALEAICLRALQRDPTQRYPSAAQFALELKRYIAGEPVMAWTPPLHLRLLRKLRLGS